MNIAGVHCTPVHLLLLSSIQDAYCLHLTCFLGKPMQSVRGRDRQLVGSNQNVYKSNHTGEKLKWESSCMETMHNWKSADDQPLVILHCTDVKKMYGCPNGSVRISWAVILCIQRPQSALQTQNAYRLDLGCGQLSHYLLHLMS